MAAKIIKKRTKILVFDTFTLTIWPELSLLMSGFSGTDQPFFSFLVF